MESSRMHLMLSLLASTFLVLLARASCEEPDYLETRALDLYSPIENPYQEKELIGALQEVLEKLKSKRLPTFEKKYGQVPMCDAGEQCAVRKGARIGRLCDCPRRTSCNSFLLKCL
uniref:Cocaine- and amphetamine-regulated transcript protein n=1 Tax=Leptobrachium leishanense TaxID=445787 RepID=A0A8C5LJF3_9ANUR